MSYIHDDRSFMDATPLHEQIDVPRTILNVVVLLFIAVTILVTMSRVLRGDLMAIAYGFGGITLAEFAWLAGMFAIFRARP